MKETFTSLLVPNHCSNIQRREKIEDESTAAAGVHFSPWQYPLPISHFVIWKGSRSPSNTLAMETKTGFLVLAKAERGILILVHKHIIKKEEQQIRKVNISALYYRSANNTEYRCFGKQEYFDFKGHKYLFQEEKHKYH